MFPLDTLRAVPNKPKTPNRVFRAEDELWEDFGKLCAEEGTDRAKDIRAYMTRRVRRWKRLKTGGTEAAE